MSAAMVSVSDLALAVALGLLLAVGGRLLLAARRTRGAPELCIGLARVQSAIRGVADAAGLRGRALVLHLLETGYLEVRRALADSRRESTA
jgi:hypothetical protein